MLPDRVSNPGPLTYESGALPIALRGPAKFQMNSMRGVGGVAETRSWLAKFKLAWAITLSKIVESKF